MESRRSATPLRVLAHRLTTDSAGLVLLPSPVFSGPLPGLYTPGAGHFFMPEARGQTHTSRLTCELSPADVSERGRTWASVGRCHSKKPLQIPVILPTMSLAGWFSPAPAWPSLARRSVPPAWRGPFLHVRSSWPDPHGLDCRPGRAPADRLQIRKKARFEHLREAIFLRAAFGPG